MGERKLNYDFYLFDRDNTINFDHLITPYKGVPEIIKKIIKQIPKDNKAVITNNGMSERIFIPANIMQYFNANLLFSGVTETEKIMKNLGKYLPILEKYANQKDIISKGINSEDQAHIGKFVSKPSTYLFDRFLEKTKANPKKCIMVGDSISDLIPANKLNMTTVLIGGIEDEEVNEYHRKENEKYATPNFIVPVKNLSLLENILFG